MTFLKGLAKPVRQAKASLPGYPPQVLAVVHGEVTIVMERLLQGSSWWPEAV